MYLHNDRNLFAEALEEANTQTGIAKSIIEKDYYVTMILKLLAERNPAIVFKGGTSLSKCFHLIDRFSEDIDITFSEHIGAARRKKLKYNSLETIAREIKVSPNYLCAKISPFVTQATSFAPAIISRSRFKVSQLFRSVP